MIEVEAVVDLGDIIADGDNKSLAPRFISCSISVEDRDLNDPGRRLNNVNYFCRIATTS